MFVARVEVATCTSKLAGRVSVCCTASKVIETKKRKRSQLKNYKFERHKIELVLNMLLQATQHEIWSPPNVEVSPERIMAWPEKGDLEDYVLCVHEVDMDVEENKKMMPSNYALVCNSNDLGPAPLQNALQPEEEFFGCVSDSKQIDPASDAKKEHLMTSRM